MTKTPEEMAEEYCNTKQLSYVERLVITKGFIDGYQAAKDSASIDTNSIDKGTKMQWISVKERLPQINKGFIGFVENKEVCNCYRYPNRSSDDSPVFYAQCKLGLLIGDLEIISHWMPLPEAPKGEK